MANKTHGNQPAAHSTREILERLGQGESIESICGWLNWTLAEFWNWWNRESGCRAPSRTREVLSAIAGQVTIDRDHWGIPHIVAEQVEDAWFGFGFAMAQDRLFQMDYLRRKGLGRLAEILGPEALPLDRIARTIGLNRLATQELQRLPAETRRFLEWFSAGVNAWIDRADQLLPIEFDLLGYRPEHWTPICSLAIENEFRWYLTGRFPVLCMPELAKRTLGEGPLYREYCLGEEDAESIISPTAYADMKRRLAESGEPLPLTPCPGANGRPLRPGVSVGGVMGTGDGTGSNNWVVSGRHTRSGKPMVASDPHIALEAVSCWYEARIEGGDIRVAGAAYVGMPAIIIGRTSGVAWGITNNICSQRDLYQERVDAAHPDCFEYDGQWEPAQSLVESIVVRGAETESLVVRFSRNGPVVDRLLPPPADQTGPDQTGPVTVRWLGFHEGGWLTALLGMNRARTVHEFLEATRPWHVPTFNLVVGDVAGSIAVQTTGRIPVRSRAERGYRPGWNPEHQWLGLIPFEGMPREVDPACGYIVTANNRIVGDDYPYPMFGTWISGHRARRIRELLETQIARPQANSPGISLDDFRTIQYDVLSLRAVECVPRLLAALHVETDPRLSEALLYLKSWDGRVDAEQVGPTLFNVFFIHWSRLVAAARFRPEQVELLARQVEGAASRLLADDPHGWFVAGERVRKMREALLAACDELTKRLGPDLSTWTWGRLHRMPLRHVLSARGDLGKLLDVEGGPVHGDMITVCNTGSGPDWIANTGAGYRFIADLGADEVWAVDGQSQSGHANSSHYSDQLEAWRVGEYHKR
ncbi:MAG: penicillin acylase family protein [Pirellulales bacterium]